MKKIAIALTMSLGLLLLAGCSAGATSEDPALSASGDATQTTEQNQDADAASAQQDSGQSSNSKSEGNISEEKAKKIALERAGVSAKDATFTQLHLDYDDGREIYEISFYAGETEYDMDVDAKTGDVYEYDAESIYDD